MTAIDLSLVPVEDLWKEMQTRFDTGALYLHRPGREKESTVFIMRHFGLYSDNVMGLERIKRQILDECDAGSEPTKDF